MQKLKNIYCSNKNCREILGQTDGKTITPVNERIFSKKLSDKKKKYNPLYCTNCHRYTRWYKAKFNAKSRIKSRR